MKDRFDYFTRLGYEGYAEHVDYLVSLLTDNVDFGTTRLVDYALDLVRNDEGIMRIRHYLFNGTQIQRNYCTLYFSRHGQWDIVKKAYDMGLIDYIQAYAR